jgi:hypothetical protein
MARCPCICFHGGLDLVDKHVFGKQSLRLGYGNMLINIAGNLCRLERT